MKKRQQEIREHLFAHDFATIHELAEAMATSVATIRRDLSEMEEAGIIERSHGGAWLAGDTLVEAAFNQREHRNLEQKRAIAYHAAGLLRRDTTCFFDAGTTVLQLAKAVKVNPLPVSIFTNGLVISQALMNSEAAVVTVLGGTVIAENASLVGPLAEKALDWVRFDQLFLGAGAIGEDCRIRTRYHAEANLHSKLMDRAEPINLLVDSSKFGTSSTYLVTEIDARFNFITDDGLSAEWRDKIRACGATLTVVKIKH